MRKMSDEAKKKAEENEAAVNENEEMKPDAENVGESAKQETSEEAERKEKSDPEEEALNTK